MSAMLPTAASFVPIVNRSGPSAAAQAQGTQQPPQAQNQHSSSTPSATTVSISPFKNRFDQSATSSLLSPSLATFGTPGTTTTTTTPSAASNLAISNMSSSSPSSLIASSFDQAARSYPSLETSNHPWRESSNSADVVYSPLPQRNQFNTASPSVPNSNSASPWDPTPGGSRPTPIGSGRQTPSSTATSGSNNTGLSTSVGAIGDGRRFGPGSSASPEKRMEDALAGLAGVFDIQRSSGAASPLQSLGSGSSSLTPSLLQQDDDASFARHGSTKARSRPSSFILGVLPSRTDDRNRTASERSNSSPLPSPSHEKLDFDAESKGSQPSPTSAVGMHSSPPSSAASLTAHNESTPRAPTPSRSPSPGIRRRPTANITEDVPIDKRVQTLEASVYDLTSFIHGEMRSLRDEVSILRGLVQQLTGGAGSNGIASRFGQHLGPLTPKEMFESPLLTVRSPSPPLVSPPGSRPIPNRTASGSFLSSSNGSGFPSAASSPTLSASGKFFPDHLADQPSALNLENSLASSSAEKDEQIAALSQQVNALASSVAQLLTGSTPVGSPFMMQGGPGSPLVNAGNNRMRNPAMPATTGLGVSLSNSSALSRDGGVANRSPLMRPHSANGNGPNDNGLTRSGSIGKPIGGRSPSGRGPPGSSTNENGFGEWDSPMLNSSPMLGGSTGTAPPGSLGSKWDVLGVGNELFRAIAKYGLGPPTKIQAKAIPCVLRNQDIVAQAPAIQERIQSYVIPALQLIHSLSSTSIVPAAPSVQVVIITATVDQAAQAQRLAVGLGATLGIRTSLYVGQPSGDSSSDAREWLGSPTQVIVGTPHRLLELLATRLLPLHDLRLLVIDECDQLIARNLSEHVTSIVRLLPPSLASNGSGASSNSSSNNGGGPPSPVIARSPLLGPSTSSPLPGAFETNSRFSSSTSSPWSQSPSAPVGVDRQTAIYSCTVPQDVLNFASSLQLREPVRVLVRREGAGGDRGEQLLVTNNGNSSINGSSNNNPVSIPAPLSSNGPMPNNGNSGFPPGVMPSSVTNLRGLRQFYFYVAVGGKGLRNSNGAGSSREWKLEALSDVLEDSNVDSSVVFCSSLESVEAVTYKLGSRGIETFALHQDMGPPMRQTTLARFRSSVSNAGASSTPRLGGPNASSTKRCLVVYDPLCRPLTDAHQVPLVINFDLPRAVEDYIHRIAGSNNAFGRSGTTINFVLPGADINMLRSIENYYRCKIPELPTTFAISGGI